MFHVMLLTTLCCYGDYHPHSVIIIVNTGMYTLFYKDYNFCLLVMIRKSRFWKADQIVTLGLFYFIGPVNGYTCTLHIHSVITGLV